MSSHREPTHAGGVVYRKTADSVEFLITTARLQSDIWVLPKGHIEPGETPPLAAVREVEEEAGIVAKVERELELIELPSHKERIAIQYFLMRFVREGDSREARRCEWLLLEKATEQLTFPEAKGVLESAARLIVH